MELCPPGTASTDFILKSFFLLRINIKFCSEKQFAEIKEEEQEYIYLYDIEDKENNREQVLKDIFSPDDNSERISMEDF